MYFKVVRWEIYVYFDVFEDVIEVVVYLKIICLDDEIYVGIILGKEKVLFKYGSLIICLELCGIFFVVEIYDIVVSVLDIVVDCF